MENYKKTKFVDKNMQFKNTFEALEKMGESKWNTFKEAIVSTGKRENVKKKWITNEILGLMQERQQILSRNCTEYMILDKTIKMNCKKAKEEWLNEKCAEIKKMKIQIQLKCIK